MDNLSIIFTLICMAYSGYEIKMALDDRKDNVAGNQAQNVISVGVLFTFIGIAISLMHFDTNPETMARSINVFLDGMKTAFYTSIVGMMAAIIIKYIQAGIEAKEDTEYKESLADIKEINANLRQVISVLDDGLKAVQINAAANTDNAVNSNVQIHHQLVELTKSFNEFITAYKATQEATDKRVAEYGESFKELNASVQALNAWQGEYKNIVDESIKELNLIQSTFITFQEVVSRDVTEHIVSLDENLQSFAKTTKLNVAIQDSLNESTSSLTEMVAISRANITAIQGAFQQFTAFMEEIKGKMDNLGLEEKVDVPAEEEAGESLAEHI